MEDVIAPISKELLKAELTEEKRLRMTNRSHNQIYIITAQDSPNTMKEIGRLREIAFRAAGGGTGKSMDIDEYDIYAYYMGQFKVGRLYNSPLRKDKNPSFAIFKGRRGNLLFKDHGTGEYGNALTFIKLYTGKNSNTSILAELNKIKNKYTALTRY